ncbi:MAG: peptidylprolyl isomerase [Candidatus Eisenbacteria bacterium]
MKSFRMTFAAAATLVCLAAVAFAAAPAGKPAQPTKPAAAAKKPAAAAADKAMAAIDAQVAAVKVDRSNPNWKLQLPQPKAVAFTPGKQYFVRMTTNKGEVVIRFMPDIAPMHVTNFLYLTKLGFYDGTPFHRVITRFMAQGGDPTGTGSGSPGYGFGGEFSDKAKHDRPGLLSMANAGPGTDGSQFFLTFVPTPWLNGKHTIFGEVVEGLDVLKALEAAGSQGGAPTERLTLEKCVAEVR